MRLSPSRHHVLTCPETDAGCTTHTAQRGAIPRISVQSEPIGKIVGNIQDIASQITLLALNTAIEPAHSAKVGRGFAVGPMRQEPQHRS
ncbi:methyl-accepting chemotaxis protein [Pseudogulbenkiania ferrooxidans]|uniref:methyl-accepting chemotaxis protein n=1 Tax=Pseudogulbenkiania ferrooxidans TaxID=549169 RepID=UPI0009D6B69B|nr:methyl-accepting chemotaxis protein [Pseudogulbenkiania ferrooxidans]